MSSAFIRIKPGREKPIRKRHPWIYSGAIAHAENAVDGELVKVLDHKDRFLARGYWNSRSQIRTRVMTWDDEPIDAQWWRRQIKRALNLRRVELAAPPASACRLVNAENDFMPGLIIDRYADCCVLQALTRYIDKNKSAIVEALVDVTGARHVYERSDAPARMQEGLDASVGSLYGEPAPDLVEIQEGAKFLVDIKHGQKTGFYLDQRDNRRMLAELVKQCLAGDGGPLSLLNVFSYTGGFALSCGHFGALHSVNVDASRAALELAERIFQLNGFDAAQHGETVEFIQADAFDYLRHCAQERHSYDIVVLDPPKFANSRRQIQRAARGYKDLNLKAFKLLKPGGWLMTFSCSGAINRDLFQKIVFGALLDSGRQAQVIKQLGAAADHPVSLSFPEGEYLKGLLLRVN